MTMKSRVLHSSANNAPPPVAYDRIVHLALASLLALGALVLALTFFGNQAGAQGEEEQTTTQPTSTARAFPQAWAVESTDFYPHCRVGVGER
jgi:hypothetical protein